MTFKELKCSGNSLASAPPLGAQAAVSSRLHWHSKSCQFTASEGLGLKEQYDPANWTSNAHAKIPAKEDQSAHLTGTVSIRIVGLHLVCVL